MNCAPSCPTTVATTGPARLRWLGAVVAAVAACVLLAGCTTDGGTSGGSTTSPSGEIMLGAMVEQTGSQASVGAGYLRGAQVAADIWNSDPAHRRVALTTCDTQSTGEGGVNCFQQLRADSAAILGPTNFIVYSGVAAVGATQPVPLLTPVPFAAPAAGTSVYQTLPLVSTAISTAFDWFAAQGQTRIATMTSNDAPGNAALEATRALAATKGIALVAQQSFDPAAQNLTPQATTIAASGPDAVLVWVVGPPVVTALGALNNARIDVPVMLNYGSMNTQLLNQAGAEAPGTLLFFGSPAFAPDTITDPAWKQRVTSFDAAFRERFGMPPDQSAYLSADLLTTAAQAAASDPSPAAVQEALTSGTPFDGLYFPSYSWSATDHVTGGDFEIQQWAPESGTWVAARQASGR